MFRYFNLLELTLQRPALYISYLIVTLINFLFLNSKGTVHCFTSNLDKHTIGGSVARDMMSQKTNDSTSISRQIHCMARIDR